MSALLLMALIVVGVYGAWLPSREEDAAKHFEQLTAERASILFARNCRLCHGDVGQGGALGARLPAAPALDRSDLQGFLDSEETLAADVNASAQTIQVSNGGRFQAGQTIRIENERLLVKRAAAEDPDLLVVERGTGHTEASSHLKLAPIQLLDVQALKDKVTLITNTITCGRVGFAMPPWGQSQGGPISDEQIRQLMVLITTGRWDLVQHEVDVEDRISADLAAPVSADARALRVNDVSIFTAGEAIRIGAERLLVTSVEGVSPDAEDKSGTIAVERGALSTAALAHAESAELHRFPLAPDEPTINQESCGQRASAAPVSADCAVETSDAGQIVTLTAENVAFDCSQITLAADGEATLRLDNRDNGTPHNIAVYARATDLTPVSAGSVGIILPGPAIEDTVFAIPEPGNYFFRCDVHPVQMTGAFSVR